MAACLRSGLVTLALILFRTEFAKAQCTDTFDLQDNYQGFGAFGYAQYWTVEDCQQMCLDTVDCIAFDFNRRERPWRNMRCWIHQFPMGDLSPNNYVDHYMRVPCVVVNSTIALNTQLPGTTQAPVTEAVTTLPVTTQSPVTEIQSNEPRYVTYGYDVPLPTNYDFTNFEHIVMEPPGGITQFGKVTSWQYKISRDNPPDYTLVLMLCRPEGNDYVCYSEQVIERQHEEGEHTVVPEYDTYVRPGDVIVFYQYGAKKNGLYVLAGVETCGSMSIVPIWLVKQGPKFSKDDMQEMTPCRIYDLKLTINAAIREPA